MGFVAGGTVVIEAGPVAATLTYPTAEGAEVAVSAILTDIAPVGSMLHEDYRVELTFLVIG
jgi:hypothetical protein